MPHCTSCKTSQEIQQGLWKDVLFNQIPCSKCSLKEDSIGTRPYIESCTANSSQDPNPDDEVWVRETADVQSSLPYTGIDGGEDDPQVPLSALVSAMSLFLSLSLPARKSIQLRMHNLPYSEIAARLGCTRQGVEKLVAQALAKQPLLQNLLPAKTARAPTPLSGSRTSDIADYGKNAKKRAAASRKPPFVPISETRTA